MMWKQLASNDLPIHLVVTEIAIIYHPAHLELTTKHTLLESWLATGLWLPLAKLGNAELLNPYLLANQTVSCQTYYRWPLTPINDHTHTHMQTHAHMHMCTHTYKFNSTPPPCPAPCFYPWSSRSLFPEISSGALPEVWYRNLYFLKQILSHLVLKLALAQTQGMEVFCQNELSRITVSWGKNICYVIGICCIS